MEEDFCSASESEPKNGFKLPASGLKRPFKAILKGLELEKDYERLSCILLDEIPANAASKILRIVKDLRGDDESQDSEANKSEEQLEVLAEQIIEAHPIAVASLCLSLASDKSIHERRQIILASYASFIHVILKKILTRKMSIILHGFFHTEDCLSLWLYRPDPFKKTLSIKDQNNENILTAIGSSGLDIEMNHALEIYIGSVGDNKDKQDLAQKLQDANKSLRMNEYAFLGHDDAKIEKEFKRLIRIEEFSMTLTELKLNDKAQSVPIPPEMPGLKQMLQSMIYTMEAQDSIDKAHQESDKVGRDLL
ncbi:hypothetical protein [Paraglaciecola sp. L1A13]|uniref:hypothetical protein n=1 Tax=Paraglaciecola sp. L1A13 TaxID=2686359 RepID=UPI00131DFBBE|nr:hypothetical protein [Paraglaciecola sp. L1A13]